MRATLLCGWVLGVWALAVGAASAQLGDGPRQRCEWGKQVVGMAREGYSQGLSRDQVLAQVDALGYNAAWKARMASAVTAWVYRGQGTTLDSDPQQDYFSRCQAYYLER
ncbi:hypothetical protein [Pseudomonas sp. NPDC007930]|uniref:hypothetical protein n=1 Tax=Pseudomonas sp. NPDC007930 TaxID=3364417 RepID=UPI0036E70B90